MSYILKKQKKASEKACERYQDLSEEEKNKKQKHVRKKYPGKYKKIFL